MADPVSIAPGAHPPIIAGAVVSPMHVRSNWPTVLGVLSLILGALGALNALWTILWAVAGPIILEALNQTNNPQVAQSLQSTRDNAGLFAINGFLSLILGCLLAFAGLRLNQRRQSGVRYSVLWAWLKIAFSIFATGVGAYIGLSQLGATQQQMAAQGVPKFAASFVGPTVIASMVLSFVWFMAYPVFTLIWFRRAGVRQTVATWPK